MDADKLKQKFPFLKNVDFEDSKTKRNIALVLIFIILVIVMILAKAIVKNKQAKAEEAQATERTVEQSGDLEIPAGEDLDILNQSNMLAVREQQRTTRISTGNRLADLYVTGDSIGEDPMQDVNKEEEDEAAAAARAKEEQIKRGRQRLGLDTSNENKEDDESDKPAQAPVTRTKPVNRSGPARTSTAATTQTPAPATPTPAPEPEEEEEETTPAPAPVRKTGGISSLDDWGTVDGITGLDSEDQYVTIDNSRPVKVMFVKDQKITSGQRVTLRLLDDIAAEGVLIPKNTHLTAQCTIGERLTLKVSNIEINGKILSLGYSAFDNDGNEGLYCPESREKKDDKTIKDQGGNIGTSLLQSAMPGVASQILNTGTSIIRSAGGVKAAQISAGYKFFLLKDDF